MKKFLLYVLICLGIGGDACAMEQPLNDLAGVLEECPNEMIGALDGESFSSLSQVCWLFYNACNAVPGKYFNIDFSDAVEHKNKKAIMHLIAQPDWIVQSNMDEEVVIEFNDDAHNIIKIFKRSFKSGVQLFLGDCSLYYMSQDNKIVRCFSVWYDSEMHEERINALWFNIDTCDNMVNKVFEKYLKKISSRLHAATCGIDSVGNRTAKREKTHGSHAYTQGICQTWTELKFGGSLDPVDDFIREFGIFTLLRLDERRNNDLHCYLLKHLKIQEGWILYFSKKAG